MRKTKRGSLPNFVVLFLMVASVILSACGDNTATSVPATTAAKTTAAATTAAATTASAATTSSATTTQAAATTSAATTAAQATTSSGTLVGGFDVGPGGNFGIFNPLQAGAGHTWYMKYFSTLVLYDINFQKMQGELAESWTVSPDSLQYTFKLRKGLTFHDGTPLTSADVKFSVELMQNPDSAAVNASRYKGIKEVQTPDAQTAVFVLSAPNASLLDALAYMYIFPQKALGSIAAKDLVKSNWWYTSPIGSGPYKWSKYVTDQYVELVAFDGYWRGKPKLEKLINRQFKEAGSAVIALRSGDIQFTYVTLDEATALKSDPNITVIPGPSQVVNYLGFNLKDPRFQDLKVRQAVMYALDRKAIVDALYKGNAQIVPCAYNNEQYQSKDVNAYGRDVAKAKSLLQEANWNSIKGQPMELLTYYGDQLTADVMATMQQMLAEAGIDVKPRAVDVPTYNQLRDSGKFDLIYAGITNGPDPDSVSVVYSSTGAVGKSFGINLPELDKAFTSGQTETDAAKRPAIYQNACKVMNDQLPNGPMWVATRFGAVSKKVGNFVYTPAPGGGRYYDASETWTFSK